MLDWQTKRYCHPVTGDVFCDAKVASRAKSSHNPENISQPDLGWKPFNDSEIGF
jgi:hypothetical protein